MTPINLTERNHTPITTTGLHSFIHGNDLKGKKHKEERIIKTETERKRLFDNDEGMAVHSSSSVLVVEM